MAESRRAEPTVDLREHDAGVSTYLANEFPVAVPEWEWCVGYARRLIELAFPATQEVSGDTIKGFDRSCGADRGQFERAIAALDAGAAVAFYGWWPTPETIASAPILGVDVMEVPTPDHKGSTLVDGHAVVLVGYARHQAFPGGGYFVVRDPGATEAASAFGCLPFAYVRTYATALWTGRPELRGTTEAPPADAPGAGAPIDAAEADRRIAGAARCADPRASYTALFFSEDARDVLRAKAICSVCTVKALCLQRALERGEPYGVWGGEFLFDGVVVPVKRGRGRPRATPLPLWVDEVTGEPLEPVA